MNSGSGHAKTDLSLEISSPQMLPDFLLPEKPMARLGEPYPCELVKVSLIAGKLLQEDLLGSNSRDISPRRNR